MAELQGRVLKNYNGYYYLKVEGKSEPYTCKVEKPFFASNRRYRLL